MRPALLLLRRLLGCTLLWCALPASACPALTRVGFSDLGLTSRQDGQEIRGIAPDIAAELAKRSGCRFQFEWFPRERLFVSLKEGRIDMTISAVRIAERDAYAAFLPFAWTQYDMVVSRRIRERVGSLEDLVMNTAARVNVTRGVQYGAEVDPWLGRLPAPDRLELVNNYEIVFGKIANGRADATLATPPIYMAYIRRMNLQDAVQAIPMPESQPQFVGIYIGKKTVAPEEVRLFARSLRTMVADKTIQSIYQRHLDEAIVKRLLRPGTAAIEAELAKLE